MGFCRMKTLRRIMLNIKYQVWFICGIGAVISLAVAGISASEITTFSSDFTGTNNYFLLVAVFFVTFPFLFNVFFNYATTEFLEDGKYALEHKKVYKTLAVKTVAKENEPISYYAVIYDLNTQKRYKLFLATRPPHYFQIVHRKNDWHIIPYLRLISPQKVVKIEIT